MFEKAKSKNHKIIKLNRKKALLSNERTELQFP